VSESVERRYPFFKEGMRDPKVLHQEYRKKIIDLLMKSKQPMTPSRIAEVLGMCELTASRTCFELTCEGKLKYFTIGCSKAFVINLDAITEMVNSSKLEVRKP
jgi:hypothetical protein